MNFQQYFSAHPLQLLYKASLKTGEISTDLKRAIISQYARVAPGIFPRTTVCIFYITLNKNIRKNIHQCLETHQKMNPEQHGFRSGRSCLSQQLEHNKILEELKESNNVDVIYLHFAKAFDKVDHCI